MFELRRSVNGRPLLVGHRGAMGVAPENSMPAFEVGLAAGADILELDVQLSADGQVVVFHDDNLEPKTGVPGRIAHYSADFLHTLDVGRCFHNDFAGTPIPLLKEVLAWAKGRIPLMIEVKHDAFSSPALDTAIVALIEQYKMVDEVVCIAFDQFCLRHLKQLNPRLTTSFIYICRPLNPLALISGLEVDAVSPATNYLSAAEVGLIQAAGYACSPGGWWWDFPTLLAWGVDTVSSNDPAGARKTLDALL